MRDLANDEPGAIEGTLLVMTCWCTVLASGVLSPVLPQIAHRFAYMPHVELLVGLVATMPALMVSLSAIPMGWLADRLGHRNVLFGALLLYGIAGIVPFSLKGIWAIIATRAFVGLGEAGAMITGTALIGLRFRGARRGRWLAAQIATSNILGIFALQLGGFLGLLDWHTPFLAYTFALLLLAPSLYFVKSPDQIAKPTVNANLPSTPPTECSQGDRDSMRDGSRRHLRHVYDHHTNGLPVSAAWCHEQRRYRHWIILWRRRLGDGCDEFRCARAD